MKFSLRCTTTPLPSPPHTYLRDYPSRSTVGVRHVSGGDYTYVNPPKSGVPTWGQLMDKGSNSIIIGEIGKFFFFVQFCLLRG